MAVPSPVAGEAVIWWIRRDMRVDDNPALQAALKTGATLIPVFVWSPEDDGQFQQGRYSRWWTKHTVKMFQAQLEHLGSRLIIRRASETTKGLMQVIHDTNAKAVFFNTLYDPISLVRDHEVKRALNKLDIACHCFNADVLYEPWEVLDPSRQPYTSFEAYWKGVLTMPSPPPLPLPAPVTLPAVDPELFSVELGELDWFMTPEQEASSDQLKFKWKPGVAGAVEKLESFMSDRLPVYQFDKAKVDRQSTSMLSPWIHTGTLSVRYLFYRVCQKQSELTSMGLDASESAAGFLQQLGYREYSRYLSFHFPFIHERSLLSHLRACPWRLDQQHFKAWRQGQTGYPLVDAAMRELWSTGWTHNRMRVVTASFMVKNLLLPWQWGLKHFWDAQMDADLECDALGWQYVSGGMTDAKPFSHMIDLEAEALKFDPDGEYVRRWLPVLARLPTKYIHAPWKAPIQVLNAGDVDLGFNYPQRIITVEDSIANLTSAVEVLESSQAGTTTSSGACGTLGAPSGTLGAPSGTLNQHPYRAPTQFAVPSGKDASGSGAPGTGTGTAYLGMQAGSWPAGAGGNTGSGGVQQGGGGGPAAGAGGAPAVGYRAPPLWQRGLGGKRQGGGGGGGGGSAPEEGASHHVAPRLSRAERLKRREEEMAWRAKWGGAGTVAGGGEAREWALAPDDEEGEEDGDEGGGGTGVTGALVRPVQKTTPTTTWTRRRSSATLWASAKPRPQDSAPSIKWKTEKRPREVGTTTTTTTTTTTAISIRAQLTPGQQLPSSFLRGTWVTAEEVAGGSR